MPGPPRNAKGRAVPARPVAVAWGVYSWTVKVGSVETGCGATAGVPAAHLQRRRTQKRGALGLAGHEGGRRALFQRR
jgi:hypothetical protein